MLGVMGCLPGEIDYLAGQASTRVVRPSSAFETPGYGSVLAGVSGPADDGSLASRLAVTAGADSPFAVYEIESGGAFKLNRELYHGCATPAAGCGAGFGVSAVGLRAFRSEKLCVAFGAPRSGALNIACESRVGAIEGVGVGGTDVGRSLAPVAETSPWGVAIAGAPSSGALFVLTPDGSLSSLPLPPSLEGASSGIGTVLASAPLPASAAAGLLEATLVVTRLGGSRLLLLAVGTDPSIGGLSSQRLGCVDGLGGDLALAAGDVTGDGVPEVFFSDADGPTGAHSLVRELAVTTLSREAGCFDSATSDDPATTDIACPTLDASVACAGFGEALALGDLDADGDQDLLVGAPDSDVDGQRSAGAVFVFPGTPSGFDEVHRSVLADSNPDADDRLGATLTTVKTGLAGTTRDEPVVGAPGAERVFVFLCTGIPGDSADAMARCLP